MLPSSSPSRSLLLMRPHSSLKCPSAIQCLWEALQSIRFWQKHWEQLLEKWVMFWLSITGCGLKSLLPVRIHGRQNGEVVKIWPLVRVKPEPLVRFWIHWCSQLKGHKECVLTASKADFLVHPETSIVFFLVLFLRAVKVSVFIWWAATPEMKVSAVLCHLYLIWFPKHLVPQEQHHMRSIPVQFSCR